MTYVLLETIGFGIEVPWWAWLFVILLFGFIFGDLTRWEYEAEIAADGINGEIEIKEKKKAGRVLKIDLYLSSRYVGKSLIIALNGQALHQISADESKALIRMRTPYEGDRPEGGERLSISVDEQVVVETVLLKD